MSSPDSLSMFKASSLISLVILKDGIPYGTADVIVCDAFVGNIVLKTIEGMASSLFQLIKEFCQLRAKMGACLSSRTWKKLPKN